MNRFKLVHCGKQCDAQMVEDDEAPWMPCEQHKKLLGVSEKQIETLKNTMVAVRNESNEKNLKINILEKEKVDLEKEVNRLSALLEKKT